MWRERNIDLWSLNHLVFGCTLAVFFQHFGIGFDTGIILALISFVLWEVLEIWTKVYETPLNRILDIVFASLGFIIFYKNYFTENTAFLLIISFLFLELSGYISRIMENDHKRMNMIHIFVVVLYTILNSVLLYKI